MKAFVLLWLPALAGVLQAAPDGAIVRTGYHLTARPWKPLATPAGKYLDAIEGICRFSVRHQNQDGAIIDPFLNREHQYATPYFANAVGTLVAAGRARDLLPNGIRAMEHATANFAGGLAAIPDEHGNFFIAALTEALEIYAGHVPETTLNTWRERMRKPRRDVVRKASPNWETYVMKGEWMRVLAGLADRADATAFIEEAWTARQRQQFAALPWRLYHDRSSDPDTLNVEAVGRGNLLALAHLGYDGPSGEEIRRFVETGTETALLLQDPSGQAPANGRTDDHVWVDTGYALGFEVMAERMHRRGDSLAAGQFRRAAMLGFESIARWHRMDGEWAGSYFVTKNRFDPRLRVGYQNASQYSNYDGSLMFHLAECYRARKSAIVERPAPAEIGGYAVATDSEFASAVANAGGMGLQANMRGQTAASSGNWWSPLGVVRFTRAGWDARLGPGDGALTAEGGVSFAPAFEEQGRWLRMADLSARYEAAWSVQFVHPLLVRCALDYRPKPGQNGPSFHQEFTLTPDGVFSELRKTSPGDLTWGVTWPVLENDGAPLAASHGDAIASTGYPGGADRQNFLALDAGARLDFEPATLRGTYGDLRPVRVTVPGTVNRTFIYPSGPGDPAAEAVRRSFKMENGDFRSVLGRVSGTIYTGRTAAGGFGNQVDLDGDGAADARFSRPCGFLLQVRQGRVVAVEADSAVTAVIQGRKLRLARYVPQLLPPSP